MQLKFIIYQKLDENKKGFTEQKKTLEKHNRNASYGKITMSKKKLQAVCKGNLWQTVNWNELIW